MKKVIVKFLYLIQGIFYKNDAICPYCSRVDFEVVFKKKKVINICRCKKCGLYWTNPIFNFPKFYNWLYKAEGITTKIIKRNQLDAVKKDLFKRSDKYFVPVLEWIKKNVKGNRLLEFGSSWGYFLYQANQLGFESIGVEISGPRREFGRKYLEVNIISDINELISKGNKFDIIFTAHTLEHIGKEINGIFKKFYELLNKGGIVLIEVPCLDIKKNDFSLIGAVHPLGFTRDFFLK